MKPTPINQSLLKHYRRSPAHYKYMLENPPVPTESMLFGQAYHTYIFEPMKFNERYLVFDPSDRPEQDKTMASNRNKEWKESLKQSGKVIIDIEDFNRIQMMADILVNNPVFKQLTSEGIVEQKIELDDFNGCPVHCRPDFYNDKFIIDLKTCYNASKDDFSRHSAPYGYHIQAAFYTDILQQKDGIERMFLFVAQETEAPYQVGIYLTSDQMLTQGRWEYETLLKKHIACCSSESWPGYEPEDGSGIEEIYLPAWAIGE